MKQRFALVETFGLTPFAPAGCALGADGPLLLAPSREEAEYPTCEFRKCDARRQRY